jgi:hypothetical protein
MPYILTTTPKKQFNKNCTYIKGNNISNSLEDYMKIANMHFYTFYIFLKSNSSTSFLYVNNLKMAGIQGQTMLS